MRIPVVVIAAVVCVPLAATAQDAQSAIRKNVQIREQALRNGDDQAWGRLETEDFMLVNAAGQVLNKAQRMAQIKGNRANLGNTSDERLRVYGDTAVRTFSGPTNRVSELWVRQGGEWKVAHVQLTPIAKQ